MLLNCLLLAIPISLDCIGIGITYGIKNTYITNLAKCIIFTIFFIVTYIAITIGSLIIKIFSISFANILGVILLIVMGTWMIFQSFKSKKENLKSKISKPKIYNLFIKPLGLTIKIIKNPTNSDLDHSNHIDSKEAIYLGFAISLDAFCAGVSCSAIGINSFFFPLFISIFHIIFLTLGSFIGMKLSTSTKIPDNIWSIVSGLLLIAIGIFKLF